MKMKHYTDKELKDWEEEYYDYGNSHGDITSWLVL